MLQDLDQRNAMATAGAPLPPNQVRAVSAPAATHEFFWRVLAGLAMIAVGWVGWVAYQVQPHSIATHLSFKPGDGAAPKVAAVSAGKTAPPSLRTIAPAPARVIAAVPKPKPELKPEAKAAEAVATPQVTERFKLALSLQTPIKESGPKAAAKIAPAARSPVPAKPAMVKPAPAPKVPTVPMTAAIRPAAAVSAAVRLNKRERPRSAADEAEALFRHGVVLLNKGRVSEAHDEFLAALFRHPPHEPSRQALISILIDRRQLDDARKRLEEGLALNPLQTQFAAVLARLYVERGNHRAAAAVLAGAASAGRDDGEFQLVRGAVLQRLGQHAEAAQALQNATRISDQSGATWVALDISFEATGRKSDAVQAYRRALTVSVAQDARSYAESRIRVLD